MLYCFACTLSCKNNHSVVVPTTVDDNDKIIMVIYTLLFKSTSLMHNNFNHCWLKQQMWLVLPVGSQIKLTQEVKLTSSTMSLQPWREKIQ